jgi:serine/threonine-protein kinase
MGVVFLAQHTLLDRTVAVKTVPCAGPTRFVEEARAAAAVRHPRLTQIYHADLAGDTAYLVMEYIDGPTLSQVLAKTTRLSPAVAVAVMTDVAAAVAELHDHDIVHRDLKASNVLLDREGHAFVTDFGLAVKKPTTASTSAPQTAGTPAYMAPEMFEGRLSPRSDTYALGILLFQLLTGRLPYQGTFEELRHHHESTPLPVEALREANIDPALIELLERAAHKQFMFRHKTAHEFQRALKPFAGDEPRARKELVALILTITGKPADPAHASPDATTIEKPPSTTTYAETIARAAAAKRERTRTRTLAAAAAASESQTDPVTFPPMPPPPPLAIPATVNPPTAPEPPQRLEIIIVVCIAILVMLILGIFLWWLVGK